jgi:hypothetical protein
MKTFGTFIANASLAGEIVSPLIKVAQWIPVK